LLAEKREPNRKLTTGEKQDLKGRPTSAEYQGHGDGDMPRANSWYWLFGGQRWIDVDITPWDRFKQLLLDIEDYCGAGMDSIKNALAHVFHRSPIDGE
jgi:hypothetical protein